MTVDLMLHDGLGEIILNRPEKLNALDDEMTDALLARLEEAEASDARALLIRGAGRGFSAGRDLAAADPANEDATAILQQVFNPLITRIADYPVPTFAAVHGPCLGVGLGIALACDVVYMADDGKIGSPFARTGGVLDSGGHHFFVSRIGSHRALELIYSGRLLSGTEAVDWGLVNRSVGASSLLDVTRRLARQAANGPTLAFRESKAVVRAMVQQGAGFRDVLAAEALAQGRASQSRDYQEGTRAFLEKRPAEFIGA